MSSQLEADLASVKASLAQLRPPGQADAYATPWYLVVGEPGTGRSSAVRASGLVLPTGADFQAVGNGALSCLLAPEAVVLEPGPALVGPRRTPGSLTELGQALKATREREPVDGLLLVLRVADFAELSDDGLESYAKRYRDQLIELGRAFDSDVPTYVVVTGYDTLWGFEDAFAWTPERQRDEPYGFTLPVTIDTQAAVPRIHDELRALFARIESACFGRLAEPIAADVGMRVVQHLVEARSLFEKLRVVFRVLASASAYERAPWFRSLAIGAAQPGMGDKPRAHMVRFQNMGLALPPASMRGQRPGGLPLSAWMKTAVLPETDLVPTRARWRDDKVFLATIAVGLLTLLGAMITLSVKVAQTKKKADITHLVGGQTA